MSEANGDNLDCLAGAELPLCVAVENEELVIRLGVNRLDGHGGHPSIPSLEFGDRAQWVEDVIRQMEADDETGATPLSDMLDRCMNAALEYGTAGITQGSPTHFGLCVDCGRDQVPVRHSKDGEVCNACRATAKSGSPA